MATAVDLQQSIKAARRGRWFPWSTSRLAIFSFALLVISIALFAAIRFHLRHMPLERDGGEYAYMGQLILEGVPPYKLASNMKLPGTYAAYAAIMAVFGQTPAGIHFGVIIVTSFAAIFLFVIGRTLYGSLTGSVTAASYVFFAARPGVLGLDGQATHFVDAAALAGMALLLHAMARDDYEAQRPGEGPGLFRLFLASGFCFGLSFLMKQPGILFGLFGGLYWLWHAWRRHNHLGMVIQRAGALIIGAALPYLLTCFIMWRAGVFQNFWFWTWTYARAYGVLTNWSEGWNNLTIFLPWAVRPFVLWTVAAIGLLSPIWSRWARKHAGFIAGFFLTSCLAVCPGLYFRPHYFIVLLPAGALCIGVAVQWAYETLRGAGLHRLSWIPIALFVAAYGASILGQWKASFHLDPVSLSWKMYESDQDFPEDVQLAAFIRSRASAQDKIGIIGSEPEICFYTHLRCATSYLYMYPLMEKHKFARQMQNEYRQQLESARPRFLIYVDNERSWGWKPTLVENQDFLDWTWKFAHTGYKLVYELPARNVVDYPTHLWGDHGAFYVFERMN